MSTGPKLVALSAVVLTLSGCTLPWQKKATATPPPQAQAPAAGQTEYPQPLVEPKPEPAPANSDANKANTPPPDTQPKPAQPVHHRKPKPSPATPETSAPVAAPAQTQQASNATPAGGAAASGESAIGQLSAGGESSSNNARDEAVSLISSTERNLKTITRPLSADEQQTSEKIRNFLDQARQALHSQDIAAAHTLATKAKLLLDELLKK
jgi:outer membrane biosynthesis protein TonB